MRLSYTSAGRTPTTLAKLRGFAALGYSFFVSSDKGFVYDPSVIESLSQDTAGTTPITAIGQTVGRISDRSFSIINATQATAAARPTYARVPAGDTRRNLLPNSNNIGAVVGVIGSGGALPTGFDATSVGFTREVVAIGETDNIPWFDLKITGTLTGGYFINLCPTTSVRAAAGQTFVTSAYVQVITNANPATMTQVQVATSSRLENGTSKNAYPTIAVGLPSTFTRAIVPTALFSDADGLAGPTAFALSYIRLSCVGAFDVTLRIGGVQLELNAATTFQRIAAPYATVVMPPRRNLLLNTDNLALWTQGNTPGTVADGTLSGEPAFRLTDNDTANWENIYYSLPAALRAEGQHTFTVRVKKQASATAAAAVRVNVFDGTTAQFAGCVLNPVTGVISSAGSFNYGGRVNTITDGGDHWLITIKFTVSVGHYIVSAILFPGHFSLNGVDATAVNVGTQTYAAPQLERGNVFTGYQRVTNVYDITEFGKASRYYLSDDMVDDALTATLPALNLAAGAAEVTNVSPWPAIITANGITATKGATGIDADGMSFVEYRYQGTATGTSLSGVYNSTSSVVPAIIGNVFSAGGYAQLVAGTLTGVSGARVEVVEATVANAFIISSVSSIASSSTKTPVSVTRTLNQGTMAQSRANISLLFTNGATIDVTFRFSGFQFVRGNTLIDYTVAYADDAGVTVLTKQVLSGAYTIPGSARLYAATAINRSLTAPETASLVSWLQTKKP